jgi:hypothetical protein
VVAARLRLHFCVLCVLCGFTLGRAQFVPPETASARSHSGQFFVKVLPATRPSLPPLMIETNQAFIRLDLTLVPVSCERIKQNLYRELGITAPWQGMILLALYHADSAEDPITITPHHFGDGWRYQATLPDLLERRRYVRAVVEVLLLEFANRAAETRSAEIPLWLSEGLAQQLLAFKELEIILPPPRAADTRSGPPIARVNARLDNPMEQTHRFLAANTPLTFDQLSWPSDEQTIGLAGELYRASAHLLVHELLALPDGKNCLCAMLTDLPRRYNWQFAFLQGYQAYFQRPVDVEKWWALQTVHFTGRELAQNWSAEESWQKLDETIRSSVQVRSSTNELPLRAQVKLQTIIQEWDHDRQTSALQAKLRELGMLRLRLSPELLPVADGYCQALVAYLQDRDKGRLIPFHKKATQRHAAEQAVLLLNALDVRRMSLQPAPKPAVAVKE